MMDDIGFTDTQNGMSDQQKNDIHSLLLLFWNEGARRFRHGDCIGADAEAHKIAKAIGYYIIIHPPIDPKKRAYCMADEIREPKEYLSRNRDIVNESQYLLATPKGPEEIRSGTWSTIRYARKMKHPYLVLD